MQRRDHYLPRNSREWSPRRLAFFDTETGHVEDLGGADLPLRMWQLLVVDRDRMAEERGNWAWTEGTTGLELAEALTDSVTQGRTTWAFAHNLGFDLGTTRLPSHLAGLGWEWTQGTVTAGSPWMRWKFGPWRLSLVDSFSHLPASLHHLGELVGLDKLEMPAHDAPADDWRRYCHRDVEVLARAILAYLDWWDAQHLGTLSVSGAQTGWNAMRHRGRFGRVRVTPDPDVRAFSRAASMGGRRSVWRVGELQGGPWAEVDMQLAHAHILRDQLLPVAVVGWSDGVALTDPIWASKRLGLIADCVISTERPAYPMATDAGIVYPVGTFPTRLAWPELCQAHECGELVSVGRALVLSLGTPTRDWASWVIGQLTADPPEAPPIALLAMKGWSHTVPGKWAAKSSRLVAEFQGEVQGFQIDAGFWQQPDVPAWTVHLDGVSRTYVRDTESLESFPPLYAFVTSRQRVQLWRLIEYLGQSVVVQANTDGVIVDLSQLGQPFPDLRGMSCPDWPAFWAGVGRDLGLPRLREKSRAEHLRILTAEHLILGAGESARRRLSGVPAGAREVDPWVFAGDCWPGMPQQLRLSQGDTFRLERRTIRVAGARPLAWVDVQGMVHPPRWARGADGAFRLAPPPPDLLLRDQHPALQLTGVLARPIPPRKAPAPAS